VRQYDAAWQIKIALLFAAVPPLQQALTAGAPKCGVHTSLP